VRALLPFCVLCSALLAGCGYRVGSVGEHPAGARSITVNPVVNRTLEPGVSDALAQDLRMSLQRDGTYRLSTHEAGDIVVSTTVTDYRRAGVSYESDNVLTVQDYRLTVTAHVVAKDRATGKVVLDRSVTGFTLVRVGSDMTQAERQALPLATTDLAQNITTLLVDGKW
jgi:hypothetical protein